MAFVTQSPSYTLPATSYVASSLSAFTCVFVGDKKTHEQDSSSHQLARRVVASSLAFLVLQEVGIFFLLAHSAGSILAFSGAVYHWREGDEKDENLLDNGIRHLLCGVVDYVVTQAALFPLLAFYLLRGEKALNYLNVGQEETWVSQERKVDDWMIPADFYTEKYLTFIRDQALRFFKKDRIEKYVPFSAERKADMSTTMIGLLSWPVVYLVQCLFFSTAISLGVALGAVYWVQGDLKSRDISFQNAVQTGCMGTLNAFYSLMMPLTLLNFIQKGTEELSDSWKRFSKKTQEIQEIFAKRFLAPSEDAS